MDKFASMCSYLKVITFSEELLGESWVPVTVHIEEYHDMPNHIFRLHFRMSKRVFEVSVASSFRLLDSKIQVTDN